MKTPRLLSSVGIAILILAAIACEKEESGTISVEAIANKTASSITPEAPLTTTVVVASGMKPGQKCRPQRRAARGVIRSFAFIF